MDLPFGTVNPFLAYDDVLTLSFKKKKVFYVGLAPVLITANISTKNVLLF